MSYRQKVFLKEFNKDEFAKFRTTYELINPDRPIETANVRYEDTDPRFRKFPKGENLNTHLWMKFFPILECSFKDRFLFREIA